MMEHVIKKQTNPVFRVLKFIGFGILGFIGVAALAVLFGYFVMLLWNWLMPEIFGLPTLNFWQAVGIVILSRLIFGGFKHGHKRDAKYHNHPKFIDKFINKEKWEHHMNKTDWKYLNKYWKEKGKEDFRSFVEEEKKKEKNS